MTGKRLDHVAEIGVSNHAVEKLRERLPPGCSLNSLADKDLRTLLQKSWGYARESKTVGLYWERAGAAVELNHVVDLSDVIEGNLVGIVREDSRQLGKPCYITVITAEMAERSRESKKWWELGTPAPEPAPEEQFMLSWEENGAPQVVITTKPKIEGIVATLGGKGDHVLDTLKLWTPVPFSLERTVRIKF